MTDNKSRPNLLLATKILNIDIKLKKDSITDARESKDRNTPSDEDVKLLYRRLENVTSVLVCGSCRLAVLVGNPDVATSSFSKMSYLVLSSTFKPLKDPFCPALYFHLHHYTALQRLELVVMRSGDSIHPGPPLPKPPPFLGSIIDFSLEGPLSTSKDSLHCLLCTLGPLYGLSLVDTAPTSRLPEILAGLDAPRYLRVLGLDHQSENDITASVDLSDNFKTFSTLQTLILGGSIATTTSSLYSSLDTLPIRTLAFVERAEVSLPELKLVITGRTKHKHLSTIHFDHVGGRTGTRINDEMGPY
ncbi:hypothetical protein JCM5353_007164 [Sporobolomyces roseus]